MERLVGVREKEHQPTSDNNNITYDRQAELRRSWRCRLNGHVACREANVAGHHRRLLPFGLSSPHIVAPHPQ